MLVHGLGSWSECDSYNAEDISSDYQLIAAIGGATGEGYDYLSALPQELHDEICQHLSAADLVSLKLCSRMLLHCTRGSFKELETQAQECCLEGGEYFRAATYLENPKNNSLLCAHCGCHHKRKDFLKSMVNRPGTSRYCHKYRNYVLEFGFSGLTWDAVRGYIAAMKEEQRTSSDQTMEKMAKLYPGDSVIPTISFPFDHTIYPVHANLWTNRLSGVDIPYPYKFRDFVGRAQATQSLGFEGSHAVLTSKIVVEPYLCESVHSAFSNYPTAKGISFSFCSFGFFLCRDKRVEPEELFEVLRELCSAATDKRVKRYKTMCTFCKAETIIFSETNGSLTIQTKRDLGPCEDEKDPLWLRHVSQREYNKPMINRVLDYARAAGEHAWGYKYPKHYMNLPVLPKRSSWRLKDRQSGVKSERAGSSWYVGEDDAQENDPNASRVWFRLTRMRSLFH